MKKNLGEVTIEWMGKPITIYPVLGVYGNSQLSIMMMEEVKYSAKEHGYNFEGAEPFCHLTAALPIEGIAIPEDGFIVKAYSENEEIVEALLRQEYFNSIETFFINEFGSKVHIATAKNKELIELIQKTKRNG